MKPISTINARREHKVAGTWVAGTLAAAILGASVGSFPMFSAAAAQATTTQTSTARYTYGPGPATPPCTRPLVRLVISLPRGSYYGGSPVPFKVQIANLSSSACSITATQPPSGLTTELVYVRIFDASGHTVLIPGGPPGLRARMLPQSLHPHQVFSYACTWNGRTWVAGATRSAGLLGVPAPPGRYTAEAVLANPAAHTGALHFVLKAR